MEGFIKLHRKIIRWEWYEDINTRVLFLHLLLSANHKATTWRRIKLKPGQLLTSRSNLALATGLSERKVRTAFSHLIATGELTSQATNKYSIVTICKWESYQFKKEETDQPTDQPANHRQEDKKIRSSNSVNSSPINSPTIKHLFKGGKVIGKGGTGKQDLPPLVYPFTDEDFLHFWQLWKDYKEEQFKFKYKHIGEQAALKRIGELANGSSKVAVMIIKQSMENGWKGFFPLKDKPITNQDRDEVVRKAGEYLKNKYGTQTTEGTY